MICVRRVIVKTSQSTRSETRPNANRPNTHNSNVQDLDIIQHKWAFAVIPKPHEAPPRTQVEHGMGAADESEE
ncbi:hypothetical protein UA08_05935 [Talaromyces atroroseus]|uniref:Uncharacterized protein n=1 Tax=Talaromyces atroroseus TaxID=1441469 RepID=A0A225AVF9_TALAT|nr:hypothetical protein UA08_05935 [Talaromyces atroroseus]OKL58956.1 hypothetical protein UA08_05935 [Talaromyces atroroseus]